jgi:transposase
VSDDGVPAQPRLAFINRQQLVLRSIDVEHLIDEGHSARLIWQLIGRLDLRLYHAQIEAVEGRAGREHTDPQLLISLWIYAYSRGVSSARELARQCEHEPGCQWLCGLRGISHRTLSGFRSDHKAALDDLFVQVLGMMSAEGLITLERVTLDGTKIKANAGGNSFRRQEKLAAHLELAREQVRWLNAQAEEEENSVKRRAAAQRRAARQRVSRLEAAVREVERLQQERKQERDRFVARASSSDPEAHVMRNGEGGTVPSYNVQLLTDTQHGIVVNVEATTDAIDYRQMKAALERCATTLGRKPKQIVADGDYTNHASVQAAADQGVDFYGSWQDSWRAVERDAQGRRSEFLASAFPYDAAQDRFTCPAGQTLTHHALLNRGHGVRTHVYRAPKKACPTARCGTSARRNNRGQTGDARSRASKNPRRRPFSSRRWRRRRQNKSTHSARRSPSFPTPGSNNAAACGSSAAEAASRPAWKPCGPASATTSSAGSSCDRARVRHCSPSRYNHHLRDHLLPQHHRQPNGVTVIVRNLYDGPAKSNFFTASRRNVSGFSPNLSDKGEAVLAGIAGWLLRPASFASRQATQGGALQFGHEARCAQRPSGEGATAKPGQIGVGLPRVPLYS